MSGCCDPGCTACGEAGSLGLCQDCDDACHCARDRGLPEPAVLLRDTPEDRERLRVALESIQEFETREGLHIPLYLHLDAIIAALRGER